MEWIFNVVLVLIGCLGGVCIGALLNAAGEHECAGECKKLRTELYAAEQGRDKLAKILMSQRLDKKV